MADTAAIMSHVKDSDSFHLPAFLGGHVEVPQPFEAMGIPLHLTKFMVIELAAAILLLLIFIPLARRIAKGGPPKGKFWNFFEAILVFLRDEVARPAIGHKEADRFLPLYLVHFLFRALLQPDGHDPWMGSPTGVLGCTGALALISFVIVIGAGMKKYGLLGYWIGQVPHMEIPLGDVALYQAHGLRD